MAHRSFSAQHFVLSRVDNIGDVVLTLPMASTLKLAFPGCRVSLLVRRYTLALARACEHIDGVSAWDEIEAAPRPGQLEQFRAMRADVFIHIHPQADIARLARDARIPLRIATSRRRSHWLTCNKLVHLRRHHSCLHEAQLNLKLLSGVGLRDSYSLEEIRDRFGLSMAPELPSDLTAVLDPRASI